MERRHAANILIIFSLVGLGLLAWRGWSWYQAPHIRSELSVGDQAIAARISHMGREDARRSWTIYLQDKVTAADTLYLLEMTGSAARKVDRKRNLVIIGGLLSNPDVEIDPADRRTLHDRLIEMGNHDNPSIARSARSALDEIAQSVQDAPVWEDE